jgi:hypothetical protein
MSSHDYLGEACTEGAAPILSERLPWLRFAIQSSRLTFPAQVPVFSRQYRADTQWRIATLYFVQGWSFERLAQRYGVTCRRIRQAIRSWAENAIKSGYLQQIPPEVKAGMPSQHAKSQPAAFASTRPIPGNPRILVERTLQARAS